MQWFRMYGEFANDPKVQMLSEKDQRRLIMLFCLKCNDDVTLQDEEVTFQLRISNEEWQQTKALFVAKNFIDKDNNILNWDKRQYRSDTSAERVRRHREKKKQACNVTVTAPDTETDTETDTDTDTEIKKKNTKKKKVSYQDLTIDHIQDWLDEKRLQGKHIDIDEHELLERFKNYCQANAPNYKDYVAAFRNSFHWKDAPKRKGMEHANNTNRRTERTKNKLRKWVDPTGQGADCNGGLASA